LTPLEIKVYSVSVIRIQKNITFRSAQTYGVAGVDLVVNNVDVLALTLRIVSLVLVRLQEKVPPPASQPVHVPSRRYAHVAQGPRLFHIHTSDSLVERMMLLGLDGCVI
jgi:hypothetical protein